MNVTAFVDRVILEHPRELMGVRRSLSGEYELSSPARVTIAGIVGGLTGDELLELARAAGEDVDEAQKALEGIHADMDTFFFVQIMRLAAAAALLALIAKRRQEQILGHTSV